MLYARNQALEDAIFVGFHDPSHHARITIPVSQESPNSVIGPHKCCLDAFFSSEVFRTCAREVPVV